VNHGIPLPLNTFQVEMKELPETNNLLSTTHLRHFANPERVHLDHSFIMPWQRRDREDVRIPQQIPQAQKDDYYGAMHAKINDMIGEFVKQDQNNPSIKVTYGFVTSGIGKTQGSCVVLLDPSAAARRSKTSIAKSPGDNMRMVLLCTV
jgi:hypothetical protein